MKKIYFIFILGYLFNLTTAHGQCTGTYASLPYSQNFSNTWTNDCASTNSDVPDPSWTNSEPFVIPASLPGWRRNDYSWWTGTASSNLAPFPLGNAHCAIYKCASTGCTAAACTAVAGTGYETTGNTYNGNLDLFLNCATSPGTQQLTFYYDYNGSGTGYQANLTILVSTNGETGPFNQIGHFNTTTGWTLETLNFASSSATTVIRFAGQAVDGENNIDIGLAALNVGTLTNCSGAPAATTVLPAVASLSSCNSSQTFTLGTNYSTIGGITYQWQTSTDNVNFTPVTGATNPTYTGSFTTLGTVYVNCVVTCTNGNSSTTSSTSTVTNSPQNYFAVVLGSPYIQGFENTWINKCNTADAPDTNWVNTPATGADSWRAYTDGGNTTTAGPNTAVWPLPTGGVTAAGYTHGSNANGASSTNSARFHSYDATAGSVGTFDLYLNMSAPGTKQISYDYIFAGATDGLGVYVSTTGPGGPFTRVDTILTSTTWITRSFTDTSTSPTYILRFRAVAQDASNDMGLDNVTVAVLANCSGAPAAATITPASAPLTTCNATQAFTLTTSYAGLGGITYQWEQSTNGGTTYTPVSGATGTTYTATFGAASTLVNCIVTCIASGQSTTSNTATVTLTPQAYLPVTVAAPYTQTFESTWLTKCSAGTATSEFDVPDANWINTPATGTNSWRRNDAGATAAWASPTAGVYALTGSNANGSSSTFSARFHSDGTTSGLNGTLDLYLDLSGAPGTKQISYDYINTTGTDKLTVLVSTTGPGGQFNQLDQVVTSAAWATRIITDTSTSHTYILRFQTTSDNGTTDIGLDNVSVVVLPSCTGTPAAATISPASAALSACNSVQIFTLSPSYAGQGGITYTWEQSTDGVNYTPVPGATTASYTGSFTVPNTLVNCIVTCTATPASITSTTATVTSTAQVYATLPYVQNFNSWTNTCGSTNSDVPDSNWVNSLPGTLTTSSAGWRRSDYAVWANDGNTTNPGTFAPYPAGNTFSARFHTDGATSGSSTLDLYLDCSSGAGAKQATFYYLNGSGSDGMVVSLSTNGAAGPFTPISGGSYLIQATWALETLNFTSTSATTVLRFTGTASTSGNGSNDIGMDNLNVFALTPCSGAPAVATVSPASTTFFTQCAGSTSQTFTLSGLSGITGLTYQWQQSTNNGFTYTSVAGATTNTYTGTFTVASTFVNCIVTCTASGQSTTSSVGLVTNYITPPYVPVSLGTPYTQGFEGTWIKKCATNDAPDIYWFNQFTTGNDAWRRSDDASTVNSATWTTPANGVYTPGGSNANGALSSFSARFHSSIAATGTTGTFDLYLDLSAAGTKQIAYDYIKTAGTSGMGVLLSTTGPNGQFIELDTVNQSTTWSTRTFTTTATSNTCVLRFRATADAGISDDIGLDNISVSVLAPCSGTPAEATITPLTSTVLACTNNMQSFLLSSGGIGGLAYQWQQSTDGATYTPITGATNITFVGQFLAPTTYVNCLVTCTASGLSSISDTATVSSILQSYASLPYTQNFDNAWITLCSTDQDVPDSNWTNSITIPIASNSYGWRRDDYSSWSQAGEYTPYPSPNFGAMFHTFSSPVGTSNFDLHLNCSSSTQEYVTFNYINANSGAGTDNLVVSVSTDGITFTPLATFTEAPFWTPEYLTFTSSSAKTILRFTGNSTSTNAGSDVVIDNLFVNTAAPCTGTPAVEAVSPASAYLFSSCTTGTATTTQPLTILGNTGIGGLTYQWEQSTNGGTTYTNIAGATTATYAGTSYAAGTTLLNCIVKCTASGLSANSGTATVINGPYTTATQPYYPLTVAAPYTQGFENPWITECATSGGIDNIPDIYWLNTPTSGNSSWRRDDDGASGVWSAPSAGIGSLYGTALIHSGSNANGASSLHFARFEDYEAQNNAAGTMDLYLNLPAGTKNISYDYFLPTGTSSFTVWMSTTGPAGTFIELDSAATLAIWATRTITTTLSGTQCILRFKVTPHGGNDEGLDNVSVVLLPPCTGTPAAGSVSPASVNVFPQCGSVPQTFSLSGATTGSGITYQWQQSTNGGATYTLVTGATNATFTGTFTTTTLVSCIVTCSGLSATSALATANYLPQSYYAVTTVAPYTQGFDNQWLTKCSADDVADDYWLSSPSTAGNSWRRDDDGVSAGWVDLSSGFYIPAGSNANGASSPHSARFHCVQLGTGSTGTLDLSLDLSAPGTKQISYDYINLNGTDNVSVLLSTNGPSGPFTQIDNVGVSPTWATRTITTTTTSNTCVLRFLATSQGSTDIGLDNVSVAVLTACSGTPAVQAISPASATLVACTGNFQVFTLPGVADISGLTYEWQQSTNGGATYTPVSGATNATYTGPYAVGTTLVNCVVTCTASGLSAISDTATVTNTSTQSYLAVTAATPYTQGFENTWVTKCATGGHTNDVPDSNWINTPSTGNDTWRRDDDGGSGGWTLPTIGAYTPAGSTANGAVSLHSARFHSYITVSGTTGSLDLYLDLSAAGTKQISYDFINTTGTDNVSVQLSTNGPSGPFTQLDDVVLSPTWTTRTVTTAVSSATCVLRFLATSDNVNTDMGLDNISVVDIPPPVLTATSTMPAFSVNACSVSGVQSFTLNGSSLLPASGNIIITAPAGFLVSTNNFSFGATAILPYNSGTISAQSIYTEFDPAVGGPASGNITFSGGGIPVPPTVAVSGIGNGLEIDSQTVNFGNITVNVPSAAMVDTLRGYNLAFPDNVTVSSTNSDFQLSSNGTTWGATCSIPITAATLDAPVYIRLDPSALGAETPATISFAYSGAACTPTFTATGAGAPACVTPGTPTNMLYTAASPTGITVNVTPSGTPAGYLLVQGLAPFTGSTTNGVTYAVGANLGNGTVVASTASPTIPVSGLIGNTTYYFTVIAYNGGPTGACGGGPLYSPPLSTSTTTCIATPVLSATTNVTAGGFTINWVAPPNGGAFSLSYAVDVSTNNTFTGPIFGSPFTTSAISQVLTGLNSSANYYYRVTAVTANGNCTPVPSATGTQATQACTNAVWLGTTSNDWSNFNNWSCGVVPSVASAVTIPAGVPNMPSINSGTFSVASFSLASNTTLTLASGVILNVAGNVSDSSTVSGAGAVVLNGTGSTQVLTGNGSVNNLTVSHAATITTGSTINITGVLTMTSGTLNTNSGLQLTSTASGTARIAPITGGSISGVVKVQQYIPGGGTTINGGERGFRFLGHPFSSSIPLSQLEANIAITGSGGGTNGFTTTNSNNPSAFWFNPLLGDTITVGTNTGWVAFTSTNGAGANAWNPEEGLRILVRGTPLQGLDGLPYTPQPVTLNMSGPVNQGTVTETLHVFDSTDGDNSTYNFLGNPYPSPTDIGTVIQGAGANVQGPVYWVWDLSQGLEGAYVQQTISSGAYFLPANASFMISAAVNNSILTFNETNKGATITNPSLFRVTGLTNGVTLHIYDSSMHSWDRTYVSFNNNAANSFEPANDGRKMSNADLDFYSLSSDGHMLGFDARPYVTGQVIPLGIATDVPQKYIIKAEDFSLPSNEEVYLHDKYLNQYQQLQDGSQYPFSITADPASQGNNRFELSMAATTGVANINGSNGLKVSMVPNPATEQVTISYEAPRREKTSVRIMNMAGQEVVTMDLGNEQQGSVTIPLHNVAAGMYMVELVSGSQVVTQRLVKQ